MDGWLTYGRTGSVVHCRPRRRAIAYIACMHACRAIDRAVAARLPLAPPLSCDCFACSHQWDKLAATVHSWYIALLCFARPVAPYPSVACMQGEYSYWCVIS
jgi:hypothetical protein